MPEAASLQKNQPLAAAAEKKLIEKGLPAQAISKIKVVLATTVMRSWNFILEAKDLKPHAAAGYKMKKIFGGRLPLFNKPASPQPQTLHEVKNEQYYLDTIKVQPKNLSNYDALGKFYLEKESLNDARDIYQYLVNHQPSNPDYQARLAYCLYQTKYYQQAAEGYKKSLALDSTQPNRYYNLSLSLQACGKHEESEDALKKALELEPHNPKFLQAMAKMKQPKLKVRD